MVLQSQQGSRMVIIYLRVEGKRRRGRQKKRWRNNNEEWTRMDLASSARAAENRTV